MSIGCLIHRRDSRFHSSKPHHTPNRSPFAVREVAGTDDRFDPTRICHLCRLRGHWRNECPSTKSSHVKSSKPVGLLTKSCKSVSPVLLKCVSETSEKLSDYTPFITNGVVHLCGGSEKSIKILRDTGASVGCLRLLS